MFFFPVGCLLLGLFILFFPVILVLLFLNVVTFSFSRLGMSPELAVILLLLMLVGSVINIPLTKRTVKYYGELQFGWFRIPVRRESGLAIKRSHNPGWLIRLFALEGTPPGSANVYGIDDSYLQISC